MQSRIHKKWMIILAVVLAAAIMIFTGISIFSVSARAEESVPSYKYYTSIVVEKGDTLWKIASRYMSPEYGDIDEYIYEIKMLNHLESDGIYAGEYLTIPYYSSDIL